MKILLLAHIRKHTDGLIANAIKEILTNAKYVVDAELRYDQKYDCIIVFNRKHLNVVKKNKELESIPIIYVFCISDTATESMADPSGSDYTFILRDRAINVLLPLYEQSTFLYMVNHQANPVKRRNNRLPQNRKKIYVDIDQQSGGQTLHNLIGFLNLMETYDINIFSENNLYRQLINKHLSIVKDWEKINEYIEKSDIVIGSGYSAMQGVLSGKEVIIVGERGYGGLVTSANIQDHYRNYFQGRNGGQIGEYIPTNLLHRDMEFEPEGYDKRKIQEQLYRLVESQQESFLKKTGEVIKLSKLMTGDISSIKFRMNTDFILSKSKGYRFNLLNKNLYNIHKRFNESECVVLLGFKEPTKIDDLLNKYPEEYKYDIHEFIKSLIYKKLILPVEVDFTSPSEKRSWYFIRNGNHQPPLAQEDFDIRLFDTYYLGDVQQREAYLTFDAGYENGYTSIILDVLKEKDVKAAFFLLKLYIEKNPDLVKRMINEGHMLCNHTANHRSMPDLTSDQIKFEIEDNETFFKNITGVGMEKYIRPPMGEYSCQTLDLTKRLGYKTIFWSLAYKDWLTTDQPGKAIAYKNVMDNLHNGAIILLHNISQSNMEALPDIIDSAREQGYIFKTLENLAGCMTS